MRWTAPAGSAALAPRSSAPDNYQYKSHDQAFSICIDRLKEACDNEFGRRRKREPVAAGMLVKSMRTDEMYPADYVFGAALAFVIACNIYFG
jgi:hypothetical protein